jgi:hypothetical protein
MSNDYITQTGRIFDSSNNVKNLADGIDSNGNRNVISNGRTTNYQRLFVGQSITANGFIGQVVNVGLGTKALNATFKANAGVQVSFYPCDVNGNALTASTVANSANNVTNGACILNELGGAPYIGIYVFDKSGANNTCNFVDLWWTKG